MKKNFLLLLALLFTVRFVGAMEEGYSRDKDPLWIKYNKLRTSKLCDKDKAVKELIKNMNENERAKLWEFLNDLCGYEVCESADEFYRVLEANKDRVYKTIDGYQQSILHWLMVSRCDDCLDSIMLLVVMGAKCNIKRYSEPSSKYYALCDKKTPLHLALEYGYFDIAKLLIWGGADKQAQDVHDYTPMYEYHNYYLKWHSKGRVDEKVKEMNQLLEYEKWWEKVGQHLQKWEPADPSRDCSIF